ncbi:hypothetical protein [Cysteiniphilum halobium]|uniref:hypothetical protein n=1 Tax=Cysteiniphilum halobium TaxID=2219059 RepID=UPI0013C2D438|nr:hypothetical protein [Cysteiniphilum halobium]
MIFNVHNQGCESMKIGMLKDLIRHKNINILYKKDFVSGEGHDWESIYDIFSNEKIEMDKANVFYINVAYNEDHKATFISCGQPSKVLFDAYSPTLNLLTEDFFDIFLFLSHLDKNLMVDSSGLTSLKYNISVNAPFLTSRWDDTEEDYPRGEEGWSGTIESICFFDDSYYQDTPINILHDPAIKEKINQYFANLKKH